jgi:queuine tRNA-ribosyltransferase
MQGQSTRLGFTLEKEAAGSSARACRFTTLHNEVRTPIFMPVATFAAFRSQDTAYIDALNFPVILSNTFHLLLRPGPDVFEKIGGIHRFMKWPRSVLTDSGGFQIFSMPDYHKITEEGALFRSYVDGKKILLTPELSIATQKTIGSDIMMVLDQCVPSTSERKVSLDAVERTARWAQRSLDARGDSPQSLFGIVQGACDTQLRKASAAQITALPFDGFAIGGLAVGEAEDERKDVTEFTASLLPKNLPRYLMGVGTPIDLLEAVHRGVDMFDCILPAAHGQQGVVYTSHGRLELRRGVHRLSDSPVDEDCTCPACRNYSRAYLHHLVKADEFFAKQLLGLHNLTFYKNLMDQMRTHILDDTFGSWYKTKRDELVEIDRDNPITRPQKKNKPSNRVLGNYEAVERNGFFSIRHIGSGEIMHPVSDPTAEARALYVSQANLAHELTSAAEHPFVIWDVGLGAATNAMATVTAFEELSKSHTLTRKLKIVSFENDLDSLRLAVKNPFLFPHIRHAGPAAILTSGRWISPCAQCEWILLEGDFASRLDEADAPCCVYYDPFSLHTDTQMWDRALFTRIFDRAPESGTKLFTYSAATKVRGTLLAAGFFVGKGPATGPKADTTSAYTLIDLAPHRQTLLGADWLDRWQRSDGKFREQASGEERELIERLVTKHPQFEIE